MRALCASCNAGVVAKCGSKRVWHWAHMGVRNCDPWWEPETEWHRNWKNRFPSYWQEIRRKAITGDLHIADVETEAGTVIEFQHSNISPIERSSRVHFYERMVWVVDGTRLKRDLPTFYQAVSNRLPFKSHPATWLLPIDDAPILERWMGSRCPVYIDFGDTPYSEITPENEPILWRLKFEIDRRSVTAIPVRLSSFIAQHTTGEKLQGYGHPRARMIQAMRRRQGAGTERPPRGGFEMRPRKQDGRRRRRF
ncbi:competence protein CoiA [Rhizobium ruizarguesonis]|uniref:competence protein CoiA n=1 Tax=Rhizobium ruizarguesonis TaxID=2081791 RepID=UPI0038573BB9